MPSLPTWNQNPKSRLNAYGRYWKAYIDDFTFKKWDIFKSLFKFILILLFWIVIMQIPQWILEIICNSDGTSSKLSSLLSHPSWYFEHELYFGEIFIILLYESIFVWCYIIGIFNNNKIFYTSSHVFIFVVIVLNFAVHYVIMSLIAHYFYFTPKSYAWNLGCNLIDCDMQYFYLLRLNAIGSSISLITAVLITYAYVLYLLCKYKDSTNTITEIISIHRQTFTLPKPPTSSHKKSTLVRMSVLNSARNHHLLSISLLQPMVTDTEDEHKSDLENALSIPVSPNTDELSEEKNAARPSIIEYTSTSEFMEEKKQHLAAQRSHSKHNKNSLNIPIEQRRSCLIFHDTQQSRYAPFIETRPRRGLSKKPGNRKRTRTPSNISRISEEKYSKVGSLISFWEHRKTVDMDRLSRISVTHRPTYSRRLSASGNEARTSVMRERHSSVSTISADFPLHTYVMYVLLYCIALSVLYFIIFMINICLDQTIDKYFEQIYYALLISTSVFKFILKKIARKIDFYRTLDVYESGNTFEISLELFTEYLLSVLYWLNYRGLLIYHEDSIAYKAFLFTKCAHLLSESWETIVRPSQFYYNLSDYMQSWVVHKYTKLAHVYDDSTCLQWRYRMSVDITIHFLVSVSSGLFLVITLCIWRYSGIHLNFEGANDSAVKVATEQKEYQFVQYLLFAVIIDLVYFMVIWIFWYCRWNKINLFQTFVIVYEFNKRRLMIGCIAVFCVTRYILRIAQNSIIFQQHL